MTETARPEPFFVADDRALDLLNSVAQPWGTEIDWLGNGRDLLAWLDLTGLVPRAVSTRFREEASTETLDEVAAQARELREWFRGFIADHAGRPFGPAAFMGLDRLNRLLAQDETYRQIELGGASSQGGGPDRPAPRWRRERRWRGPESLLLPLAEAMGELICRGEFARVKHCEGPDCTLWFRDVSKNHTRRWCSMSLCGNRVKAAEHRAKKRSARAGPGRRG